MSQPAPPSVARLAALAALLHLGFDTLLRSWPATAPPHLQTPYMGEVFREMLELLGRTPVSIVTSAVYGLVSAIFTLALQEVAAHRRRKLAALLTGLWFLSGGLTFALYLDAPGWLAATSLLAGVPRMLAVAFFLERALPPAGEADAPGDDAGPAADGAAPGDR